MDLASPEPIGARAARPRSLVRPRAFVHLLRLLAVPGGLYAGLVSLLYFSQEALLFPGRETQGEEVAEVSPGEGVELLTLATSTGDRVKALYGGALTPEGAPVGGAERRPTLLYFYGNGTWLASTVHHLENWRRLGVNVLIPEYAGYGLSTGSAGEAGCYATADAAYDYLVAARGVNPKRLVLSGSSLGGAVAIDLAVRRPAAGLATFMGFTSLAEVAQREFPIVPVSPFLKHRFENERKLRRVRCPILIGHGTADDLVPYWMSDRLARAAAGPVTRVTVEEAGHNDFFARGGERVDRALATFVAELTGGDVGRAGVLR